MILFYNATKGGIDTVDQMAQEYSVKWTMAIFFYIVDLATINAVYAPVHQQGQNGNRARGKFLMALSKDMGSGMNWLFKSGK